jgi:hypothetical protein
MLCAEVSRISFEAGVGAAGGSPVLRERIKRHHECEWKFFKKAASELAFATPHRVSER